MKLRGKQRPRSLDVPQQHSWLQPAIWRVGLGSWQWIHQVAVGLPCNVTRGSGMTYHWIRQVAAPCNVACRSGIMTVNSPGGSTLQCGRWLWDDMPLNSPKRPPYWNSTSGFNFGHITAVDMSLSKSDYSGQKKMTSCRFSRCRISAILDFRGPIMGSLKSPRTTSCRSSIDTIAVNCLLSRRLRQRERLSASMLSICLSVC